MTKEQRLRIMFWGAFGFLGLVRTTFAVLSGDTVGLVYGVLWLALGFGKAWSEAKRVDATMGQPRQMKQPDRPSKTLP